MVAGRAGLRCRVWLRPGATTWDRGANIAEQTLPAAALDTCAAEDHDPARSKAGAMVKKFNECDSHQCGRTNDIGCGARPN
jgi:hypothetical protein